MLGSKFTSLITKALLCIKLWLTQGCLNMHHFTPISVCTNSQLIHTDTSVQKPLPPLGPATFLRFSRFSQSSALPSHAAIKRVKVFQDPSTWREAITLISYISIQLRSEGTQFYRSINTIISTPVPRYRSSAVITAKWLRVTLLRDEGPTLALGHLGTHPVMA